MSGLPHFLPAPLGEDETVPFGTVTLAGNPTQPAVRRSIFVDPALGGDWSMAGGQIQFVGGAQAIRQKIQTQLSLFQGEWFLDEDDGLPYFQSILVKAPNLNAIRGIYRSAILAVPGVTRVDKLELVYDARSRSMSVKFSAFGDEGQIVDSFTVPLQGE